MNFKMIPVSQILVIDVFTIWKFSEIQGKLLNPNMLDLTKYWAGMIQCISDNYSRDVLI